MFATKTRINAVFAAMLKQERYCMGCSVWWVLVDISTSDLGITELTVCHFILTVTYSKGFFNLLSCPIVPVDIII